MSEQTHVIEAGLTGDILIAQAAGWRVVFLRHVKDLALDEYRVTKPDGSRGGLAIISPLNPESDAWRVAMNDGYVPCFTTDLNAAITLINIDPNLSIELADFEQQQWGCSIEHRPSRRTWFAPADTPALAVCRAWWAWHEAQKESE